MNILYCGDRGIGRGLLVSILSLLMNGRKRYDEKRLEMVEDEGLVEPVYNIYIMTIRHGEVTPFKTEAAKFLDELVKRYNKKSFVKLVDATEAFKAGLPKKNMGSYFTPCSMLRLYIDKVPELAALNRVLYLDYDVVCRGSIVEFYNADMNGIEAAGVLDIYGRIWYHYNGLFVQDYMNSGVMLFNIPECLKMGMFEKARKICIEKRMLLPDQGALNRAILRRKLVERKYNEQEEKPRADTVLHHFSNNFKFWPYFRVQKVKPFEVRKVHEILKIHEYDDILEEYNRLKGDL
ncbi:glycosyltransferase family 8 protein [Candidatus Saccharibacteria bacterium]|nr:glycosyltransferase family 8 protein [Candidatus Saccharibacteria bacterium]